MLETLFQVNRMLHFVFLAIFVMSSTFYPLPLTLNTMLVQCEIKEGYLIMLNSSYSILGSVNFLT